MSCSVSRRASPYIEVADFNEDGKMDFRLSMFGFLTGRFSWFENLGDMKYAEHVLHNKPGAVKSVAYDFNNDGHRDLAVLFGQETDGMLLFTNDGKGKFTQSEIFRRAGLRARLFRTGGFQRRWADGVPRGER